MSWWDDGPDVLGDGPADLLRAAWRRILAQRGERALPKPSLDEALRAYASAMRSAPLRPALRQLELRRKGSTPQVFIGDGFAAADLVAPMTQALQAMGKGYLQALERPLTPNEAAKTFEFVVSADPGAYLSEPIDDAFWGAVLLRALPAGDLADTGTGGGT